MKSETSEKIKDEANIMALAAFGFGFFLMISPHFLNVWFRMFIFGASIILGASVFYHQRKLDKILKNEEKL